MSSTLGDLLREVAEPRPEPEPRLGARAISESEYVTRFTSPTQTDWVMRCTARKVLRLPEDLPIKAAAKAQRAA